MQDGERLSPLLGIGGHYHTHRAARRRTPVLRRPLSSCRDFDYPKFLRNITKIISVLKLVDVVVEELGNKIDMSEDHPSAAISI